MLNKISKYISDYQLIQSNQKVLVGISGGRDSVSLALILKELGYSIALAHCNFKLRGKESDEDEQFVVRFAQEHQLELFKTQFETEKEAKKLGISIQMAARDLRYNWFEKIRTENQFTSIAIAHNRDDIIETFFINLIRGTGIEGLSGIKAKNGSIIRPILDISRDEINQYIQNKQIDFREDSSNASTKYIRNKLRHTILPELRSISKSFDQTMSENIDRLNQVNKIYKNEVSLKQSKILIHLSDSIKIDIQRLKTLEPLYTYLYEFLKSYGFTASTIKDIEYSLDSESGKKFSSKTHQLVKDRDFLILQSLEETKNEDVFFNKETQKVISPIKLNINIINNSNYKIDSDNSIASLDLDKLNFPLQIRLWKHGDYFMPLGMNRMKKVSDFLIDSKVSVLEKEKTYVIQSRNDIVWIVGKRIDDRYKITKQTKKILRLSIKTN